MSEQVMTQAKPIAAKPVLNSALQRTAITPVAHGVLQRCSNGAECAECRAKREQQEGTLQRAAVNTASTPVVPPIVHDVLNSPGQPLDAGTRPFMESCFSHDFSQVRVHATLPGRTYTKLTVNAFKVCVRGFTNEITWCFTFAGKKINAGSRGRVFVDTAGLLASNLINCDDFLKDVKQLQPDN